MIFYIPIKSPSHAESNGVHFNAVGRMDTANNIGCNVYSLRPML